MPKCYWLLVLLCFFQGSFGQTKPIKQIAKNKFTDSLQAIEAAQDMVYDLPVIVLDEQEQNEHNKTYVPSLLGANRDILASMAAFHFNIVRYRLRGYESRFSETLINGVSMMNPIDGNTQFGLWNGLNDVTRNTQSWQGLRYNEGAFGNIGNTTTMDMRASKQKVQEQVGYAFSNRNFTHRWMLTKSKGMNRKGWAFTLSGSFRYADEGYVAGTSNNGYSYYLGIDKRISSERLLSVILFGSYSENGRQGAILQESAELAGSHYYNPYWGDQSGEKRNANISKVHQPVLIITHEKKMNNHSTWYSSLGGTMGTKSSTALDWYNAPDPRPDYYRYLPSYQNDSLQRINQFAVMQNDKWLNQINWAHLYEVNKNSMESVMEADGITGNIVTGLRSHYILEERVTTIKRIELSSVYNTQWSEEVFLAGGISLQFQSSRYYKKISDLLGGEYYVDWNQFAERDFPNDPMVIQNDINHPNRILTKGDVYGYNYAVKSERSNAWIQFNGSRKKIDYFGGVSLQYLYYQRDGYMQNGLFPDNSYGSSEPNEFADYACKAGITYKINGRKYLYLNGLVQTKAPLFDDVFISPRTRNTEQESISHQKIGSLETGYVWNAPSVKMRVSAYVTQFSDGMNISTFYHDGYGNFVNYALTGINKIHVGLELGIDYKLSSKISLNIAASIGRYYENSRQRVTVTADNDAAVIDRGVIYSKNYRVAGTPQEAFGIGFHYQSTGSFYIDITGSYFREQWVEYNPLRRTYAALENIQPGTNQWNKLIQQIRLTDQYTVDLSAGSSFRSRFLGFKKKRTLVCYLSVNNLLNNQNIISGGYEQLRFDAETKNPDKFPPKYYYAMGLNFSANISLRL